MARAHVKRNDIVVVITGADQGKRGKVLDVDRAKGRVIVEGVNRRKKHVRRSQLHPQGAIDEREFPIHISNVMQADKYDARHEGEEESKAGSSAEKAVAAPAEEEATAAGAAAASDEQDGESEEPADEEAAQDDKDNE